MKKLSILVTFLLVFSPFLAFGFDYGQAIKKAEPTENDTLDGYSLEAAWTGPYRAHGLVSWASNNRQTVIIGLTDGHAYQSWLPKDWTVMGAAFTSGRNVWILQDASAWYSILVGTPPN